MVQRRAASWRVQLAARVLCLRAHQVSDDLLSVIRGSSQGGPDGGDSGFTKLVLGALRLDFANTADWRASARPHESLETYEDLGAWSPTALDSPGVFVHSTPGAFERFAQRLLSEAGLNRSLSRGGAETEVPTDSAFFRSTRS